MVEVTKGGGLLLSNEDLKLFERRIVNRVKEDFRTRPEMRRRKLRELLDDKRLVRILEAHNGLTGFIAEETTIGGKEFDGMWLSSLTVSMAKGKPDSESLDWLSKMTTLRDILEVTTKPIIYDGDSGGERIEDFVSMVQTLEQLGVSAVIIEDKKGPKRNSLLKDGGGQKQDSIKNVCSKIRSGKQAQVSKDFMVIARIESLILNPGARDGVENAMRRARAYVGAGADGIMIHSNKRVPKGMPKEILEFCKKYSSEFNSNEVPLVAVPSTYPEVPEHRLAEASVRIVIYANQMLRSAYVAMVAAAESILRNESASEADKGCLPIKETVTLIS